MIKIFLILFYSFSTLKVNRQIGSLYAFNLQEYSGPTAITISSGKQVQISTSYSLTEFGNVNSSTPTIIADSTGTIFVGTGNNALIAFKATASSLAEFWRYKNSTTSTNFRSRVAVDNNGTVYAVESGSSTSAPVLYRLDHFGKYLDSYALHMGDVVHHFAYPAIGPNGEIYVATTGASAGLYSIGEPNSEQLCRDDTVFYPPEANDYEILCVGSPTSKPSSGMPSSSVPTSSMPSTSFPSW